MSRQSDINYQNNQFRGYNQLNNYSQIYPRDLSDYNPIQPLRKFEKYGISREYQVKYSGDNLQTLPSYSKFVKQYTGFAKSSEGQLKGEYLLI